MAVTPRGAVVPGAALVRLRREHGEGLGLKDPWDEPYRNFVGPVNGVNKRVYERV
jgi:hypothetical protein